jgi:pimeloyl-ACP methyl ester carboxylesterase
MLLVLIFSMLFFNSAANMASASDGNVTRYTALVLDLSGSMSGNPMVELKKASEKFCNQVLGAEGNNYVAIVNFDGYVFSEFTNDLAILNEAIDTLRGSSSYPLAGLDAAWNLFTLENLTSDVKKNIIIMSDGEPGGDHEPSLVLAQSLWTDYYVYSLGFFQNVSTYNRPQYEEAMRKLQNAGFYPVEVADDFDFAFGELADDILGSGDYPIILIPGVMGSHLFTSPSDFSSNTCVWPPDALFEGDNLKINNTLYVRPYDIDQQTLTRWDASQEVSGTGQREYGGTGAYKEIIDKLCDSFPNRPVYFFSYDWRQNNVSNAEKLRQFIEQLTGAENAKVDLVCHSMGGLLVSSYYDMYDTDHRTNKIITAGTPYEGSPYVFSAVLKGDITDDWWDNVMLNVLARLTKDVKRQFWSIPQLAPTRQYVEKVPFKWVTDDSSPSYARYSRICMDIFGEQNVNFAQIFQNGIRGADGYNVLLEHPNSYFIIGKGIQTIGSVKFDVFSGIDELIEATDLVYENKGDGTVPYLSGSIMGQVDRVDTAELQRRFVYTTDHGGLVGHTDSTLAKVRNAAESSLNKIIEILKGNPERVLDSALDGMGYTVIRIACPVDAAITYNGETLSSNESNFDVLSSFGRMDVIGDENDPIKMFCLDVGDYDVALQGTDTGTMDYSIRFFNEDENLEDERNFLGVQVTDKTIITTSTVRDESTILYIDDDGDGKVDRELKAVSNETVEAPKNDTNNSGGGCSTVTGMASLLLIAVVMVATGTRRNRP